MTEEQKSRCHSIIHAAAAQTALAGGALAQVPGSDYLVIVPIQINMIKSLGDVFSIHVGESIAKSLLASTLASVAGRTLSQILIGWMPGLGNVVNAATAAGLTETIGWISVQDFASREARRKGEKYRPLKEEIKDITGRLIEPVKDIENIDIEKYISPAEEKKIDEHLKVYDTGLTGLITGKKSVDETEMTQLLTGRVPLYGAYLIIYDREGNSKRISLKNKNITVGRTDSSKKDVDINLAFYDPDKKVSRKHAEIFQTGEGDFYIKDSGSSNGTYLNKKELDIHKEYILKDGDEILFGKTKAIFAK